jgi:hypothetical protein
VAKDKDPFDDLFEPFELEDGPPPPGSEPPPPAADAAAEAPPAAPVEQVACPSCGAHNPGYNRHCEECGARLTKESLPVAPAPMVRATPGGRALSVLAAAVLIVALIALLVNVFRGSEAAEETTTTLATTTTAIADTTQITPTQVSGPQLSDGFGTANLIDDDLETEWQVNQATSPLVLEFRFAQPVSIRYIEVYNIAEQDRFLRNYRIQGYKITVDDLPGVENRNTLKDLAGTQPQRIDIASIDTTTLTFEVLSNYPSSAIGDQPAFEELAAAEIKFWGTSSN